MAFLILLLLLCLSIFIEPSLANAATYYVAKSGRDSNTCVQARSQSTPKLTITEGIDCLAASDTLLIKAGTYVESFDGPIPSGTASAYTTIRSFGTDDVIMRPTVGGAAGDVMRIGGGRSYIKFGGGSKTSKLLLDAINVVNFSLRVQQSVHHILIEHVEAKNTPDLTCVVINGSGDMETHHVTFRDLKVHDCGIQDLTHQHHGIYLRGNDHVVEYSEVYNTPGFGIHQWAHIEGTGNRNIVRYNRIHNNTTGILIGNGDDNVAHNNLVWNNGGAGIRVGSSSPTNNQVYNNTIYSNDSVCIDVRSDSKNTIVKNNICWRNNPDSVKNEGTGTVISDTLTIDPKFRDPATFDFRITQGSPAIDNGTPIPMVEYDYFGIERPQGSSYDIGAHEWTSQSQDVTAPTAPRGLNIN